MFNSTLPPSRRARIELLAAVAFGRQPEDPNVPEKGWQSKLARAMGLGRSTITDTLELDRSPVFDAKMTTFIDELRQQMKSDQHVLATLRKSFDTSFDLMKLEKEAIQLSAVIMSHKASELGARFRELQVDLLDLNWKKAEPEAYAARKLDCESMFAANRKAAEEETAAFRRWTEVQNEIGRLRSEEIVEPNSVAITVEQGDKTITTAEILASADLSRWQVRLEIERDGNMVFLVRDDGWHIVVHHAQFAVAPARDTYGWRGANTLDEAIALCDELAAKAKQVSEHAGV